MSVQKPKTYESNEPCVCCGLEGEGLVTYHHLFTRKVYPEFAEFSWNKIPVCLNHHTKGVDNFHSKGTVHMAERFPSVKNWLISNNWFFCDFVKKYRRNGF